MFFVVFLDVKKFFMDQKQSASVNPIEKYLLLIINHLH